MTVVNEGSIRLIIRIKGTLFHLAKKHTPTNVKIRVHEREKRELTAEAAERRNTKRDQRGSVVRIHERVKQTEEDEGVRNKETRKARLRHATCPFLKKGGKKSRV